MARSVKPSKATPVKKNPQKKAKQRAPTTAERLDAIGAEVIFERIAQCEFIHKIAESYGMSATSLHAWLDKHPEMYARARERQADKLVEDMLKIADDGENDTYLDENGNRRTDQDVVARSRLRVDARKWLAGKMNAKRYGDKLDLTGTMTVQTLTDEQLIERAQLLKAKLGL